MLYEFRSRVTGGVTMIGKAAEQVLKIIGKSPDATGIITVAQIPAAIATLEQAAEREQPPADQPQDADDQNLQEDELLLMSPVQGGILLLICYSLILVILVMYLYNTISII